MEGKLGVVVAVGYFGWRVRERPGGVGVGWVLGARATDADAPAHMGTSSCVPTCELGVGVPFDTWRGALREMYARG